MALLKMLRVVILNEVQQSEESLYRSKTARFFRRNGVSPVAKSYALQAWLSPVRLCRTQNDTGAFQQTKQ
jgi:hypothetical protein